MSKTTEYDACAYSSLRSIVGQTLPRSPLPIASTSFVFPASVGENVERLTGIIPEIGICMFESRACLDYTDADLPPEMADFPTRYHVHLPVDYDWKKNFDSTLSDMVRLMEKCAFFSPVCWVLHPPPEVKHLQILRNTLEKKNINPSDVLLENIAGHDLCDIWTGVLENGFSVCLDIGHILAYGQDKTLDLPGIWEQIRMIHAYAPGRNGRHTALGNLDRTGQKLFRTMLQAAPRDTTLTLEVFSERDLIDSMAFLGDFLQGEQA